jgi:outer membrane protein assembly factor BamB
MTKCSPTSNYLALRTLLAGICLLVGLGCAGAADIDPLAPVPTRVDPADVATPRLREAWTATSLDSEGEIEGPTHAAAVGAQFVFVAYPNRIEAFDHQGLRQWATQLREPLVHAPVALRGGVALASETGWLWINGRGTASTLLELAVTTLDAIVIQDTIVVVGADRVHRLRQTDTGSLVIDWTTGLGGAQRVASSPDYTTLYVASNDGSLTALAAATGSPRWRSTAIEIAPLRPAVGQHIYVIGADGRVYALRLRDGKRAWAGKDIGIRIVGSPVVVDKLVWAPGLDAAAHAFTISGGSHQFRIPGNGRMYLDLAVWRTWVIASPQYGPWLTIEGPRQRIAPSNPGTPVVASIASADDIALPPAVGAAGVALIDNTGTVRFLTPLQGPAPHVENSAAVR